MYAQLGHWQLSGADSCAAASASYIGACSSALEPAQVQVFLTAQGRALALATCYVLSAQSVMLTAPAEACELLATHMQKYILYGDQVRESEDDILSS